jgi:hypothetical protein
MMAAGRVIATADAKLAVIAAARVDRIAAGASEVAEIGDGAVAVGTIDRRFATNSGLRLGPKSAVHRKPTIILRSSKRPWTKRSN